MDKCNAMRVTTSRPRWSTASLFAWTRWH